MELYQRQAKESHHDPKDVEIEFKRLHKPEMVRQWMQSQVIPGYIFAAGSDKAETRPIDVVVISHGSLGYSLLLQGVRTGAGMLDRLKIRRPVVGRAEEEISFASCDRNL